MTDIRAGVRVRASAVTHRGAVRAHNEDTIGVAGWVLHGERPGPWISVLTAPFDALVADGLGGHRGGATASRTAVDAFLGHDGDIRSALDAASAAVFARASGDERLTGMGATIVGVRVSPGGNVVVFNVGDSRAYRVTGAYLVPLTRDDRMPLPNGASSLTQVIGGARSTELSPHEFELDITTGDRLLLCSDGVHGVLGDDRLHALLEGGPVTAVRDALLDAGAPDNLSYVVLDVIP